MFRHYEFGEPIAAGGMGAVWKGTNLNLGAPVAIKMLDPRLAADPTFVRRFELEAKAASLLEGSRLVRVIDFGKDENDTYYIVMEYVNGRDLRMILKSIQDDKKPNEPKGVPAEIALLLLLEIAQGLKAAHDLQIIHRDVKPANIMINRQGEVKIADFGLARDMGDIARMAQHELTRSGSFVGTPAYMAPEMAAGKAKQDIDHRADIFSLGVVAYEILAGGRPFTGDESEVRRAIIAHDPPPLTTALCPLVNPEILHLLERMLAKDPTNRQSSMEQVMRDIEACIETVDTRKALFRNRTEYLVRFAAEPAGFSREILRMSISDHRNLALRYRGLGEGKIGDALCEFRRILAMDPDDADAAAAIAELVARAESVATTVVRPEKVGEIAEPGLRPGATHTGSREGKHSSEDTARRPQRPAPAQTAETAPPRISDRSPVRVAALIAAAVALVILGGWGVLQLLPGRGSLRVESEPVGASVFLRKTGEDQFIDTGKQTTSGGVTIPEVAAGEWEVELRRAGYAPGKRPVTIRKNIETSIAISLTEVRGKISVTTIPTGANVSFVAGGRSNVVSGTTVQAGVSPVTEFELVTGDWNVRAELSGFAFVDTAVTIDAQRPVRLELLLARTAVPTGAIIVTTSPPGARVSLRGPAGAAAPPPAIAPCDFSRLDVGRWTVIAELRGYDTERRTVVVVAGDVQEVPFALRPVSDSLPSPKPTPTGPSFVRGTVAPASDIYVDGDRIGRNISQVKTEVTPDRQHEIEIRNSAIFGRMSFMTPAIPPGETFDFGHREFQTGRLSVSANQIAADVMLDGVSLSGQTPLQLDVAAQGHVLSASRSGFRVKSASISTDGKSFNPLESSGSDDGSPRFPIAIGENQKVYVRFVLEK